MVADRLMAIITTDQGRREGPAERRAFARVRMAEMEYSRRLRRMASYIWDLVRAYVPPGQVVDASTLPHLATLLDMYGRTIEPWARTVASRFLGEVNRRDEHAWRTYGRKFSRALETEIRTAPTGQMLNQFLETQVDLITSIPLEAAQRVHQVAVEHASSGGRYTAILPQIERELRESESFRAMVKNLRPAETDEDYQIRLARFRAQIEEEARAMFPEFAELPLRMQQAVLERFFGNRELPVQRTAQEVLEDTGRWVRSRANLIARTESSRVASALTMVRAQHIGSEGYTWRTARDSVVRDTHRAMEGVFVRWDSPPVVDEGKPPYHAGMIYNCRCYCEPTIPDRYGGDYVPSKTTSPNAAHTFRP